MGDHVEGQLAPLVAGTLAPDFTLPQSTRARLALHSLRGRPLVMVFYPLDWELVSREQLILYQSFAGEFDRWGARVLGISVDHALCHAAFARDAQLHFPLLADFLPRGAVASQYGVFREARGVSARALFIVDRWSIIRFSRAYPDLVNPGVDDVLTALEALPAAQDESTRGFQVADSPGGDHPARSSG